MVISKAKQNVFQCGNFFINKMNCSKVFKIYQCLFGGLLNVYDMKSNFLDCYIN
jgi:hypothetical protein